MPLAAVSHVAPQQVAAADLESLVRKVRGLGERHRALVVGHSNTVPALIRRFGVDTPITIGDSEYDNLFVIVPQAGGPPRFLQLRF